MRTAGPASLYATVSGALLAILGLAGFFYESSFATGDPGIRSDELLGVIAVNGWQNLFHLATGLVLLTAAASGRARTWALGFGLLFALVAVWGLIAEQSILGLLPVNRGANLLHLAIGVAGLGAGAATPAQGPAPAPRNATSGPDPGADRVTEREPEPDPEPEPDREPES